MMTLLFSYFILVNVNYSKLFPTGGGPQILGSCQDPEEIRISELYTKLQYIEENTFTTFLSIVGDSCMKLFNDTTSVHSKYAKIARKQIPDDIIDSILSRAPPMEKIGETIRKQSDGIPLDMMRSINMEYYDLIYSVAHSKFSLLDSSSLLSGFEFIHVIKGRAPRKGVWHADPGTCPRLGRLVSVLKKENFKYGNIDIVLPEFLEKVHKYAKNNEYNCLSEPRDLNEILTQMACNVRLEIGDVFYFGGNVYHRTSDNIGERISIQVSV